MLALASFQLVIVTVTKPAGALPIRLLQEMLHVCLEFSKQSFVLARIVSCPLRLLFLVFEKFSEKRIERSCVE